MDAPRGGELEVKTEARATIPVVCAGDKVILTSYNEYTLEAPGESLTESLSESLTESLTESLAAR